MTTASKVDLRCQFQVIGSFSEGGDGAVATGIASGLQRLGITPICVALKPGGKVPLEGTGIECIELDRRGGLAVALFRFRGLVRKRAPELVHVHGPSSLVFVVAALLGFGSLPRIWFTWHDSGRVLEAPGIRGRLHRWALGHCSAIFGSSQQVVEKMKGKKNKFLKKFQNEQKVLIIKR